MTDTGGPGEPAGFERLRPRLEGIAYRMTGSVADAQDLAQEAWLRWSSGDRSTVDNAEAYLVTTVTRLALDLVRSAARRREAYVGPYLPEPFPGGAEETDRGQPEQAAVLADSLTYSFLVLLDELGPVERAVLLLHDVFGYPFEQVAEAVDRSPAAVRQAASRARRHLAEARRGWTEEGPRLELLADRSLDGDAVLELLGGLAEGDVGRVLAVLAPDVVGLNDGGPARRAARRPVVGAERVARLWLHLARTGGEVSVRIERVNGVTAVRLDHPDGRPDLVLVLEADAQGRVAQIFAQLNEEKLRHLDGAPPG